MMTSLLLATALFTNGQNPPGRNPNPGPPLEIPTPELPSRIQSPYPEVPKPKEKGKETTPNGPAPYTLFLKAGDDGEVKVKVVRQKLIQLSSEAVSIAPNGQQEVEVYVREVSTNVVVNLKLEELKDFNARTVGGTELTAKEVTKLVSRGMMVLVSSNGGKIDPNFLQMYKSEIIIITVPELFTYPKLTSPDDSFQPRAIPPENQT